MKRAAVIGCGALGTILVTNFARAEGWTLTGVMARTKAHAEAPVSYTHLTLPTNCTV